MKKLFIICGLLLVSFSACTLFNKPEQSNTTNTPPQVQMDESNISFSPIVFTETSFDFGLIKQSGGKVKHDFTFTYQGTDSIEITGVPTSCACTSAKVNKTKFSSGDTGILTVVFNPNLHAESDGKFYKSISFLTKPKLSEMPEVKIWVEIDLDLGESAFELKSDHDEDEEEHIEANYNSITAEKFHEMMANKDFILIDTHIPEQMHIANTDLIIPYTEIGHSNKLPKDKNAKIVLYCRSGGMSRASAYQLAKAGYVNIYDLVGGKNAYDSFLESNKIVQSLKARASVGHIEFEAEIINQSNFDKLNIEMNNKFQKSSMEEHTFVALTMNNHRENLSEYPYLDISFLNDEKALSWDEISNTLGGHHLKGLLKFKKTENPTILKIRGLSVGDAPLTFKISGE